MFKMFLLLEQCKWRVAEDLAVCVCSEFYCFDIVEIIGSTITRCFYSEFVISIAQKCE